MLNLKIVSPEKIEFEGQVERVVVPGTMGRFEILQNHAPIISPLVKGEVVYDAADGKKTVAVSAGFVMVQHNQVDLCVEI